MLAALSVFALCVVWIVLAAPVALAQQAPPVSQPDASALSPYNGRPVRDIRFEGLSRVTEQFARNQLRTVAGQGFDAATVTADIRRLYSLYEFETVQASVEDRPDGSVTVIFTVLEAPIVQDVQVVGNRSVSDDDISQEVARINLTAGTPVDRFRVDRARRAIEELYHARGYHTAQVVVDEDELVNGIVLFRVREGERVKLMAIRFEGARSFSEKELRRNVSSQVASIFRKGALDEESLDDDVTSVRRFYISQGFLDARVDRRLTLSPNGREGIASIIIDEGPRYRLRHVRIQRVDGDGAPSVFSAEQVIGLIPTKPGDAYASDAGASAEAALLQAYNRLGYVDARVQRQELRDPDAPMVDLVLMVSQGERFRVGEVVIQGNTITKQSVIRRQLRFWPDRPLDVQSLDESKRRLQLTRLFARPSAQKPAGGVKITMQPEDPAEPGFRDVLVQIEDANTGSLTFLAAASADAGFIGSIGLTERNFDIKNYPRRLSELGSRRRFRGGGQTLSLVAAPGTQIRNFSAGITEPYLFQTNTSFAVNGSFRDRIFREYDEQRLRAAFSLGRRFGDRWVANSSVRTDTVQLSDIDADAPVDAFAVSDSNTIFGVSVGLTRTTVPATERLFPTRGSRTQVRIEQVFGDFNFSKFTAEHQFFLPVSRDALGRTSVLSFKFNVGVIPQTGEAPIYERFFLGGSTFRGFDFRGVSPRGIRNDTKTPGIKPKGGNWSFFAGAEYTRPLFQDILSLVFFLDTGTVEEEFGFGQYRASIGVGLRIRVPALGPVPLAFDFGIPIQKEENDDLRLFTFTADIPF